MKLNYTIFGESHGDAIGVVIENFPSGIFVDMDAISRDMARRRPTGKGLSTSRIESDAPKILSGVFEGKTTGAPFCVTIANEDTRSTDYEKTKNLARPSHADFTGNVRYEGCNDYRGGGHFSGRLTAPLVFAGSLAKLALKEREIAVGAHILQIGEEKDDAFDGVHLSSDTFEMLATKEFSVLNDEVGKRMKQVIQEARMNLTSVGGTIQCGVTGMPCGIGSPDRENLEGILAKNIFRVPAVKGIEFGLGFQFASAYGHEVNDEMVLSNTKIVTKTNYNGGIWGG
ncbi:MAG: chorismate synthase, partial [Oscillospiraceae bacterium]